MHGAAYLRLWNGTVFTSNHRREIENHTIPTGGWLGYAGPYGNVHAHLLILLDSSDEISIPTIQNRSVRPSMRVRARATGKAVSNENDGTAAFRVL